MGILSKYSYHRNYCWGGTPTQQSSEVMNAHKHNLHRKEHIRVSKSSFLKTHHLELSPRWRWFFQKQNFYEKQKIQIFLNFHENLTPARISSYRAGDCWLVDVHAESVLQSISQSTNADAKAVLLLLRCSDRSVWSNEHTKAQLTPKRPHTHIL